jgi:hypothetical protein
VTSVYRTHGRRVYAVSVETMRDGDPRLTGRDF